jgi:hypothetical protein
MRLNLNRCRGHGLPLFSLTRILHFMAGTNLFMGIQLNTSEYPLLLAKENHFVFNPPILQIIATFQHSPNILVQHQ